MTGRGSLWAVGIAVAILATGAALSVAAVLPAGYDFHAYWLGGRHLLSGEQLYPGPETILGLPDEFRYLPAVAVLFVPFALLPYETALWIWTALEVVVAAAVGFALVRRLPFAWRPWAAAGYIFFLGLVLEVTLGNVNLFSLALALAAWRFRSRALPAGLFLAAAIGLKFLPLTLVPFYVASGRSRAVAAGAAVGAVALAASTLALPARAAEYIRFAPRLLEQDWVYAHIGRPEPAPLAAVFWSDSFPLALAAAAVLLAIAAGIASRRDRDHEDRWHALVLATAGYLAPFGYFWTTFLILSLPLAADLLREAAARPSRERALLIAAVVLAWALMEPQQVRTLVPILAHFAGVMLLCTTAALTLVRVPAAPRLAVPRPSRS